MTNKSFWIAIFLIIITFHGWKHDKAAQKIASLEKIKGFPINNISKFEKIIWIFLGALFLNYC